MGVVTVMSAAASPAGPAATVAARVAHRRHHDGRPSPLLLDDDIAYQLGRLERLRARGLLTSAEIEAATARLLPR